MTLEIEPREWDLPRGCVVGPSILANAAWKDGPCEWEAVEMRAGGEISLYFREIHRADAPELVATATPSRRWPNQRTQIRKLLREALETRRFGRVLWLDAGFNAVSDLDNVRWRVFLGADGTGNWHKWQAGAPANAEIAGFRWRRQLALNKIVALTPAALLDEFQTRARDKASDVAFARAWLDWDFDVRCRSIVACANGTPQEFENVLRCAAHASPTLWGEHTLFWVISPELAHQCIGAPNFWESNNGDFFCGPDGNARPLSALQRRVRWLAARVFEPCFDESKIKNHLVLRTERGRLRRMRMRIEPPSAHQRLEAMLQLRAWLQNQIPASEIAALLGI